MRVLVTGGSGLVGRFVAEDLSKRHEVEILDLIPSDRTDLPFHKADILNPPALDKVIRGFEAVVHLAGIPHPLNHPPEVVFRTNAVGTLNMLEASADAGIRKFIFMSSESTLGFAFSTTRMWPEYAPLDEEHPTRPQDPYGLSKLTCELLCAGQSARSGMQTVCLRAPWIWCPVETEIAFYRGLVKEYKKWCKNLWAWIHVADVSQAILAALENKTLPVHEVFFLSADKNWTGRDSRELLAEFFPETKKMEDSFSGAQSLISFRKAQRLLNFNPQRRVEEILTSNFDI